MTARLPRAETDPAYTAGGATDAELAAAIDTVNTALAAKQDSDTAATDAELAAAVAVLNASLASKQDAASAATDAELAAVSALVTPTAWTTPSLSAGWSLFTGFGFQGTQYRKVGDRVELRGFLAKASAGVVNETIFTLPAGFRPPAATSLLGLATGNVLSRADVATDGTVRWQAGNPTSFFQVDGRFSVTA